MLLPKYKVEKVSLWITVLMAFHETNYLRTRLKNFYDEDLFAMERVIFEMLILSQNELVFSRSSHRKRITFACDKKY